MQGKHESPDSASKNLPVVASLQSKLATVTKIAEERLEIINRLQSKLEAGGSIAELPAREMELHEKTQLYKKLCTLEPEHLGTACSFAHLTNVASADEGDYTLDLSKQDRKTLWRLWEYARRNAPTFAQQRAADKRQREARLQELREREGMLLRTAAITNNSDSSDDDLSSDSSDDDLPSDSSDLSDSD